MWPSRGVTLWHSRDKLSVDDDGTAEHGNSTRGTSIHRRLLSILLFDESNEAGVGLALEKAKSDTGYGRRPRAGGRPRGTRGRALRVRVWDCAEGGREAPGRYVVFVTGRTV